MVGRCERLKAVLQGLCPVGFGQGNVGLERLRAESAHHEGTCCMQRCSGVRQIGAHPEDSAAAHQADEEQPAEGGGGDADGQVFGGDQRPRGDVDPD